VIFNINQLHTCSSEAIANITQQADKERDRERESAPVCVAHIQAKGLFSVVEITRTKEIRRESPDMLTLRQESESACFFGRCMEEEEKKPFPTYFLGRSFTRLKYPGLAFEFPLPQEPCENMVLCCQMFPQIAYGLWLTGG